MLCRGQSFHMLLFGDSMQRTVARSFFFYAGLLSRERGAVPHKRNTPAHRGGALHWQEL